jgi:hypothetical protein
LTVRDSTAKASALPKRSPNKSPNAARYKNLDRKSTTSRHFSFCSRSPTAETRRPECRQCPDISGRRASAYAVGLRRGKPFSGLQALK